MQDRIVQVITTLSDMLREQNERAEENERATNDAVDLSAQIARELASVRTELDSAYRRSANLENELSYQRRNGPAMSDKASLFDAFIASPEGIMAAMAWLRSPEATAMRHENAKIAMIKRVREIACLGLKQAKDYVEAYMANPTMSPADTLPPSVDLNPCKDSSCLNG